jgi:hypothetical protein
VSAQRKCGLTIHNKERNITANVIKCHEEEMNRNILVLPLQRPMQGLPDIAIYHQEKYNA